VRLRPELLALLIILLAIPFAARRNRTALAVLAFAFTLGYTVRIPRNSREYER
jgi:hypothetical protein